MSDASQPKPLVPSEHPFGGTFAIVPDEGGMDREAVRDQLVCEGLHLSMSLEEPSGAGFVVLTFGHYTTKTLAGLLQAVGWGVVKPQGSLVPGFTPSDNGQRSGHSVDDAALPSGQEAKLAEPRRHDVPDAQQYRYGAVFLLQPDERGTSGVEGIEYVLPRLRVERVAGRGDEFRPVVSVVTHSRWDVEDLVSALSARLRGWSVIEEIPHEHEPRRFQPPRVEGAPRPDARLFPARQTAGPGALTRKVGVNRPSSAPRPGKSVASPTPTKTWQWATGSQVKQRLGTLALQLPFALRKPFNALARAAGDGVTAESAPTVDTLRRVLVDAAAEAISIARDGHKETVRAEVVQQSEAICRAVFAEPHSADSAVLATLVGDLAAGVGALTLDTSNGVTY